MQSFVKTPYLTAAIMLAITVLGLDQVTKVAALGLTEDGFIRVLPFFNLVLVWNQGVSFGMLGGGKPLSPYLLAALSGVIAIAFAIWVARTDRRLVALAGGLVIGGAVGNIIDRFRYGAVVDFLDFHAFGWHWPAFNIADSAIVVGIALILFDSLLLEPRDKRLEYKEDSGKSTSSESEEA